MIREIKVCDRCGKTNERIDFKHDWLELGRPLGNIDLCVYCRHDFERFMQHEELRSDTKVNLDEVEKESQI